MKVEVPASAPASIEYWALLDHFMEKPGPGAPASANPAVPAPLEPKDEQALDAAALGPGFLTAGGVTLDDGGLQPLVQKVIDGTKGLARIRFALVDLTGAKLDSPKLAANLPVEQAFGASLVKIAAMIAAYQLQYDLNVIAKKDPSIKTKEALFLTAWQRWLKSQDDAGVALKKENGKKVQLAYLSWNGETTWARAHGKPFLDGAPNLANIFDVVDGSPLKVQFKQGTPPGADGAAMGEFGSPDGKAFYERMFAMIHYSDNVAAGSCILDVGYLFIISTLIRSGLFADARGGGLWLAATYNPGAWPHWKQDPQPVKGTEEGGKPNPTKFYQVATPAAVAAVMTLLAQEKLVSRQASQEMKFLLDKRKPAAAGGAGTWSPAGDSLDTPPEKLFSKLGLNGGGDERRVSDAALIDRKLGGKDVRYAISLIDLKPTDEELLGILIPALENVIRQANGI